MAPELPTIYENPRFDHATPTLQPVIQRALRFGAILGLEWGTLTLIEGAPRYVKYASVAVAVLALAVLESWPWLRMRGRYWFSGLMGSLVAIYVAVFAYAELHQAPAAHQDPGRPATTSRDAPEPRGDTARAYEETDVLKNPDRKTEESPPKAKAKSVFLGLTDERRWQIMKAVVDGPPSSNDGTYNCQIIQSFNNDNSSEAIKSRAIYSELQQPLFYAGWRFTQGSKTFIPRGFTIIADSRASPSWTCATRLKDLLVSFNVGPVSLRVDVDITNPDSCSRKNCLEVLIGKLDNP